MISLLVLLSVVLMTQGSSLRAAQSWNEDSRIIGGSNANDGAFPYQISLRYTIGSLHFCGGSVLNIRRILTAGHCLYQKKPGDMFIWCNTNQLNSTKGQTYYPKTLTIHENYIHASLTNDIAIIEPTKDIVFSPRVKSIPLDDQYIGANIELLLSGWGYYRYPNTVIPNDMQWLKVKSISQADCKSRPTQLCTKMPRGKGACMGDSGGPLVLNGKQVGVVSYGTPCAVGDPDFYTRISAFIAWINKHTT